MKARKFVSLVVSLTFAAVSQAQVVTISDQNFFLDDWDLLLISGSGATSAEAFRIPGAGVTGAKRLIEVDGFGSITYRTESYKTDRPWIPAIDGAITSIDWSFWYRFDGRPSTFAATWITARQGDTLYQANSSFREPSDESPRWQQHRGVFSIGDFRRTRGSGPARLDFSPCAEPIEFGYANAAGVFIPAPASHCLSLYELRITTAPICYADFNGDGTIDLFDFLAYGDAFDLGKACADCDRDGSVNILDYLCFLNEFAIGCPG